ncbi:phospholipase D-like domain-containing protein [uncultured Paracoccus sp.]|uniref:phospholipase D-like domain-containing protein n=1 Tax=uncultured Paracoccus sp. TaxID=189685 RepID=UPI002637DB4E|nr:phospholipase D-like domain-containing protein [uncultured Paracoccus sp.]
MKDFELLPGRNCWRAERTNRFSLIIDAQDYFRALREVLIDAHDQVLMIGWDFDFEIEMLPGESDEEGLAPDGLPNQIGPFFDALADRKPQLDIYLLKWSGGALIAPGRLIPSLRIKLLSPDQVHLAFDGRHPIGACHHQKIVVVDDRLAFCGGIDVTDGRWDSRGHLPGDPRRKLKSGVEAQPWHDAAAVFDGAAAKAMGELARMRWHRANDEELPPARDPGVDLWPDSIRPDFADIGVGISRTEPPGSDKPPIAEIETLYLDGIASARDAIYMESQYFSAGSIVRAIAARLSERHGPEVVVINPRAAQGAVEDRAMHVIRSRAIRYLSRHDPHDRFRILYPVNEAGEPIYVHAKLLIVDDRLLRVGSSNIDRRSMGFDTEADVSLVASRAEDRACIRRIRAGLIGEHLDQSPETVEAALSRRGSMVRTIDALNERRGRGLKPVPRRRETLINRLFADTKLFDPRYRRSARDRLGLTGRHLMIGAGVVGLTAGLLVFSRRGARADRNPQD